MKIIKHQVFVEYNEIRNNNVVYLIYKTGNSKKKNQNKTRCGIMEDRICIFFCQSRQATLFCGINKLQKSQWFQ